MRVRELSCVWVRVCVHAHVRIHIRTHVVVTSSNPKFRILKNEVVAHTQFSYTGIVRYVQHRWSSFSSVYQEDENKVAIRFQEQDILPHNHEHEVTQFGRVLTIHTQWVEPYMQSTEDSTIHSGTDLSQRYVQCPILGRSIESFGLKNVCFSPRLTPPTCNARAWNAVVTVIFPLAPTHL